MSCSKEKLYKKSRRFNISLYEDNREFLKGKKRKYGPGQHGQKRKKISGYGLQLQEKQKIRYLYGLSEKQLYLTYKRALKIKSGKISDNLLILLESRLDNICFRLGFSSTRAGARQLVSHGHILINNKKVNIPSYQVKINEAVSLVINSQKNIHVTESLKAQADTLSFLDLDRKTFTGKLNTTPQIKDLNKDIKSSAIVEWYNK